MKKLLYLVHRIPYPPNKGDKIRSFHFLEALAQEYRIYLGTFIDDPDDRQYIDELKGYCQDSYCVDLQAKTQKIKSLQGLLRGEALSLPYYRNTALQSWVDKTIREQNIERVLIFSSPMAQYVEKYPELHLVADFVDVDSDKWRQYALNKSWPASWIYRREAETLLAYEKSVAIRAKTTLLVSEQEAQLFKTLAPELAEKIDYVNNGVDTVKFDPELPYDRPFAADQLSIVFTGAMDYWANVDAVVWFAEQVLPFVKRKNNSGSRLYFYIVGSKPAKQVLQLAQNDSDVIVTGRVEDVRPYIAHAQVIVAPLRIARGIQNKVLEAMAMAKPIVATSAAMEGIPAPADLPCAIADRPEDFADRVWEILQQPGETAAANRNYVQSDFSWGQNGRKLCGFFKIAGEE